MGTIRGKTLLSLMCVCSLALLGPACGGDGDGNGDDFGSGGSGEDGDASGGKVGTGGKGAADGGSPGGGASSTGGKSGSDGGSPSGGSSTGGASAGGNPSTGGSSTGGASAGGNPSTGGLGGDIGSAGDSGYGGEGGAPPEPEECGGCLKLFVPLAVQGTGTNFHYSLPGGAKDMSDTVVTFRLKVESEGSGGFYQFYAMNPSYASYYSGWTALSTASDFVEVSMDLGALDNPQGSFVKSDVIWIGIDVTGGNSPDNTLGDTTVYVDSITYSDEAAPHVDFAADASGFGINSGNSPLAGSTVEWVP